MYKCILTVNIEDTAPILKKDEPVPVKKARVGDADSGLKGLNIFLCEKLLDRNRSL